MLQCGEGIEISAAEAVAVAAVARVSIVFCFHPDGYRDDEWDGQQFRRLACALEGLGIRVRSRRRFWFRDRTRAGRRREGVTGRVWGVVAKA